MFLLNKLLNKYLKNVDLEMCQNIRLRRKPCVPWSSRNRTKPWSYLSTNMPLGLQKTWVPKDDLLLHS